jgi:hypothetical protein
MMKDSKPLFSPNPPRSQALLVAQPFSTTIPTPTPILKKEEERGRRRRKGGRERE